MNLFSDDDTSTRVSADQARATSLGGSVLPHDHDFAPGELVADRYKVLSVVGRGGFGCVYKVFQVLLKKEFALKTLNPTKMSQTTIQRFSKEAQAAGRLDHPNLVRAVDFGMIDGVKPYLVMDFVEGPTLAEYLQQRGRLDLKEALHMFIPITMALAYAHKEGVVHRDLKPSNIILCPFGSGSSQFIPKIVDFGIAKIQFGDETQALTLTGAGDVFGTPLYMSPEQCAGIGVDSRSDIYALGCLLFEALTGAPPFRGGNAMETMMQHGFTPLPTLKESSLGIDFPPALENVLAKMLAKEPSDRYQTCMHVAEDLIALERGDFGKVRALTTTGVNKVSHRQSKKRLESILFLCLGIILGAAIGSFAAARLKPDSAQIPAKTAIAASQVEDAPPGFKGDPAGDESEFFFHKASDGFVFQPPPGKHHNFGQFFWWDSGRLSQVAAASGKSIPNNARLIFEADGEMLTYPYLWAYFRPTDLSGVLIKPHTCWLGELVNSTVRAMPLQDNLRLLCMSDKSVSEKALDSIGTITNLRWLDLDGVTLNDDQIVTGSSIAKLPNLKNLRVLRMDPVDSGTSVLLELGKASQLRRLGLRSKSGITAADVKLIERLASVDTLSLRGVIDVPRDKLLDALSHLPNLQRLELDYLASDREQDGFKKLSHLKTLVLQNVHKPDEVNSAVGKRLPAHCELMTPAANSKDALKTDEQKFVSVFFDPLIQDPDQDKLW